ncbi:hypothetical protein B9H04_12960 [Halorubrum ezzemoulense DSM 17463]|uniref:CopG family transcriptional regulator n=1 Tax=Halorubrum ezzemoulense DSM 17463 TaxID=1121945 RepID=A0A1X4GJW7_HALEZ|nr:hypothetical protein [Halorubrum ezzemoulense]OSO97484.1 hypothetical protein B9H04_12960 [Halorubrum ezzemoulense DSM 17463]
MARSIEIPDDVSDRLEERVTKSEFDSVEAYITFVLQEVAKDHPEIEDTAAARQSSTDESRARENLKSLGYLE